MKKYQIRAATSVAALLRIGKLERNKTMPNPVIADREKIQRRFLSRDKSGNIERMPTPTIKA